MASILRSGKLLRYFAGFTRSLTFNTVRETEGSLVQNSQYLCNGLSHGFASTAAKTDQNLEKQIKRLDQDVRRTGRISRRDIEEVLEEIRLQRTATSSQSLLVIRCCGNLVPEELPEVRTALVQEIWKTLNSLNVPMDISHYNALLRVYLENEHSFSPTEFLADLESKGVEPNRVTYQRLITRYCQLGDIEGATRILEFMREKGLPVNENVFNALIMGHSQANDMESAARILVIMKQAGLEPTADTYTTLICCYARHGDLESIIRVIDECETKEIYLLDKDLLDTIYALAINGHADKVDPVILKLRKSSGFNQDTVNIILRLTNKGYEDVAFKLLKTMTRATRSDGELADTGNFFIRQLVKANRPIEKILEICQQMEAENLNPKALLIAVEAGIVNGTSSNAMPLLNELKKSGFPIRQHYFWPLICSSEKPSNIFDILKTMQNEFDIIPNGETIRDYVLPNLKENNFDSIIFALQNVGISNGTAAASVAHNALIDNKLKKAADIAEAYRAYFAPNLFKRPLINALAKTNDYDSFVRFIRQMYDNLPRNQNKKLSNDENEAVENATELNENISNQREMLGEIVSDAVQYFKRNRAEVIEKVLQGLVHQGLAISNSQAEKIQERIGSEMTANISELLGKLTSGELEPVEFKKSEKRTKTLDHLTIEELENFISNVEKKNENANNLKRYLIAACIKSKNIEKTEEVLKSLESSGFQIAGSTNAQLIELYCHHNNLKSALEVYTKAKSSDPDFVFDNFKIVRIAELMIKENKIDDAIKFLESNKKDSVADMDGSFNYKTTCWRLLNSLAESGNAENVNRVFDTLTNCNYINSSNVMLGPLVKVHLVNDDIKNAIDTFQNICEKYKSTPWKNELSCRLIQAEDATNLQRLTDLSTNIHGEVNSLYDLVFSFVECGRIRQARKILETPGLRSRPQRINYACERYLQEGMVQPLEGLIEATKDLNHIDRNEIYYNLLLSYCKDDEPDKALGLWTKMQEEDINPSDAFLIKLSEFLKEKNIEVPFVVPDNSSTPNKTPTTSVTSKPSVNQKETNKEQQEKINKAPEKVTSNSPVSDNVQKFKKALKSGDIDAMLSAKKELSAKDKVSVHDQSLLVENLIKAERLNEATRIVDEMLQDKIYPIPKIFSFLLNKLALSGDVASFEKIGNQTSDEIKKVISFDNRYCHANLIAGKIEQYLKKLVDNLDNAKTDEELKVVFDKFPRGGALGILDKHPEVVGQFEELAEKYVSKGCISPMNVLWIHYFTKHNDEVSQNIWDKHLKSSPRLMFQRVLQVARDTKDDKLTEKLLSKLRETKISEGALGNAYSCYLDVLTSNEKFDEGLIILKKAVEDVCLENINKTALQRLKTGLESSGKQFPYTIPQKASNNLNASNSSSSSSSDSSSDEDVIKPKPETIPKTQAKET